MAKRRVTLNNSRKGSARHNDRDRLPDAEHIDPNLTQNNWTWTRYGKDQTFEEVELEFYERHFRASLDARNARYRADRHPERVRTMEQYIRHPKSCPEETIMQLGTRETSVSPDVLRRIIINQLNWEQKTFPNVKLLDVALHVDEPNAAPHVHVRKAWLSKNWEGDEIPCQAAALREMDIPLPNPDRPETRTNCAKMTYTRMCREHLQGLCREYGLDIETVPQAPGKAGMTMEQLKAETARAEAHAIIQDAQQRANAILVDAQKRVYEQYGGLLPGRDRHPDKHPVQRSGVPELRDSRDWRR